MKFFKMIFFSKQNTKKTVFLIALLLLIEGSLQDPVSLDPEEVHECGGYLARKAMFYC